jgi:hypothetical protein
METSMRLTAYHPERQVNLIETSWSQLWDTAKDWEEDFQEYRRTGRDPPGRNRHIAEWIRHTIGPYPATEAWAEQELSDTSFSIPLVTSIHTFLAALRADGLAGPE